MATQDADEQQGPKILSPPDPHKPVASRMDDAEIGLSLTKNQARQTKWDVDGAIRQDDHINITKSHPSIYDNTGVQDKNISSVDGSIRQFGAGDLGYSGIDISWRPTMSSASAVNSKTDATVATTTTTKTQNPPPPPLKEAPTGDRIRLDPSSSITATGTIGNNDPSHHGATAAASDKLGAENHQQFIGEETRVQVDRIHQSVAVGRTVPRSNTVYEDFHKNEQNSHNADGPATSLVDQDETTGEAKQDLPGRVPYRRLADQAQNWRPVHTSHANDPRNVGTIRDAPNSINNNQKPLPPPPQPIDNYSVSTQHDGQPKSIVSREEHQSDPRAPKHQHSDEHGMQQSNPIHPPKEPNKLQPPLQRYQYPPGAQLQSSNNVPYSPRQPPPPQQRLQPPQQRRQAPLQGYSAVPNRNQRPPQQQQAPPVWKRLWRKIEVGLDSLADIEESVVGGANKLYSATVETASAAIKTVPQLAATIRVPGGNNPNADDDLDANSPVNYYKMPARRKTEPSWTNAPPSESLTARHESMRQQQLQQQQQQQQPTPQTPFPTKSGDPQDASAASSEKKVDWSIVMSGGKSTGPILATGGASSRPGDTVSDRQPQQTMPVHPAQGASPALPTPATTAPITANTNAREDHRKKVQTLLQNTGSNPQDMFKDYKQQQEHRGDGQRPHPSRRYAFDDDDDDDKVSWKERIGSLVPRIPSLNIFSFGRSSYQEFSSTLDAWSAEDGESERSKGFMGFGKRKSSRNLAKTGILGSRAKPEEVPRVTSTVSALIERCEKQQSTLLKEFEKNKFIGLGRKRALLDLATIFFALSATRELIQIDPLAIGHSAGSLVEAVTAIGEKLVDGWFNYAALGAVLSLLTNHLLLEQASSTLASSVGEQVLKEAQYGSMFLRLVLSIPTKTSVVEQTRTTSKAQAVALVEATRLNTLITCLLATLVMMTFSFIQSLLLATGNTLLEIASLEDWRSWPLKWKPLWSHFQQLVVQFLLFAKSSIVAEIRSISRHPFRFAYEASLVTVMILLAQIPRYEMARTKRAPSNVSDETDTARNSYVKQTNNIWNLGASSATRLQLASKRFDLDELLERWRTSMPAMMEWQGISTPMRSLIYFVFYGFVGGLLLCIPVFVLGSTGVYDNPNGANFIVRWESIREVAAVLVYTHFLFLSAMGRAVEASVSERGIVQFLADFTAAVSERSKQLAAGPANLQLQASISPTEGISVRDLWAAHSKRRAWAVQGANLVCRSGELVVVLGDDGSGKSRLMTSLAEAIVCPPKQALTVVRVRGSVMFGSVDVTKWDPNQLRRRVGLMLNDVRTVADFSQALSGLTVEEVIEPRDGTQLHVPSITQGSKARACMALALKMTGLDATLLPRLPSKLSTVVTANEEDLDSSPMRSHYSILSPVEWSKLLLARVLCQAIFDNESAAATYERVENSLLGSLLLLDDATAYFSETDEGPIFRNLRSSMAATVLTSTRWATGRWADRVVVLKDGVVVETGSHNELLNRGPQQSLYAAKWAAMT
ncbi:hypothetical protein ACA910_016014 [Epithemia clementina (nom. ined.)]